MNELVGEKRYMIRITYDGTLYHGWQVQKGLQSVAGTLQSSFKKVFAQDITLYGVSRTDAGVHAFDQVAVFNFSKPIAPDSLLQAWNNKLPNSIVIRSLKVIPVERNPHQGVIAKTYWYHIFTERPVPFNERYGWFYRYPLDTDKLKSCLQFFEGTHDFRSFSTGDDRGTDTVRRIDSAHLEWSEQFSCLRIAIRGPRFLRYMVRRVVGACVEVAANEDLSIETLKTILEARNPDHTLLNAPAQGLMLANIEYEEGVENGTVSGVWKR